ncbi:MAG: type II secretion system protein [Butyrivibrio sp.]|nr:type II secretion system protein [Butyrivibrio sp.]
MKKLMRRMREEKGFTLAELLIVVAIIAVLVAIAIPIFSAQLEKSREATDLANVRAAYATLAASYITDGASGSITVSAHQTQASWQTLSPVNASYPLEQMVDGSITTVSVPAVVGGNYIVIIDSTGSVTVSQ